MKDYIERDALRYELINTPFYPRCKTTPDLLTSVQDRLTDTLDIIDKFPVADVKPVRRGRWEKDNDGIDICSECASIALQRVHIKLPEKIVDLQMVRSRFCPNCGAELVTGCNQLEEDGDAE